VSDIFISYAKEDSLVAREIAYYLEGQGYSVWWDTNLTGGDDYQLEILKKVRSARVALVLWSKDAIASKWVRSEAAAALDDDKLLPVKLQGVTYEEIPPPFNLLHAIDVAEKSQIELAVARQLAKPRPPPLWKRLRYELFSWIGVIGASLSFAVYLEGFVKLSRLSRLILDHWSSALQAMWRTVLFFVPQVAKTDAIALSIVAFTMTTTFLSPVVTAGAQRHGRRDQAWIAASFAFLLLLFSLGVYASIGEGGTIYDLARSTLALLGVDLTGFSTLRQAILVVVFVMMFIAAALFLVIGFNALMARYAPASREASVASVSTRLHRIVIGVLCVLALSQLEGALESLSNALDRPMR
jgi:hypothetical protein